MKKFQVLISIIIAVIVTAISLNTVLAATVYSVSGYSFSLINNTDIALCGWDNRAEDLVVPASIAGRKLTEIEKYGLANNDGFTSLDFSQAANLKTIGYGGFANCAGIANDLVIPRQVSVIGFGAFQNCVLLPSVTIEADVASIQNSTFQGCTALKKVVIQGNTQTIAYQAFANCPNLSYVEIPRFVTSISAQAFSGSPNVVIYCYYNSYAHTFAKTQNIPYVLLDNALLGDANGDGSVNINDVTAIQRFKADMEVIEGINLHAADVNGDGDVTIEDATILQRFFAEYDDIPYSIGEVMTQ